MIVFSCPEGIARDRVAGRSLPHRDNDSNLFEKRYADFSINHPAVVEYYREKQLVTEVTEVPGYLHEADIGRSTRAVQRRYLTRCS